MMRVREEEIPDRIRKGDDRKVIALLYEKVLPNVERYIVKNGGRKEDAYDVFQDAITVFYKQVIQGNFDTKYKVYGYIYRISLNYWINKLKKDNRIDLLETYEDIHSVETELPAVYVETDENLLNKLFSAIGQKCIDLLTYTIYNDLLMEDIMIRMEFTSVSAVKMQAKRCKEKLMKEIELNPHLAEKLKGL